MELSKTEFKSMPSGLIKLRAEIPDGEADTITFLSKVGTDGVEKTIQDETGSDLTLTAASFEKNYTLAAGEKLKYEQTGAGNIRVLATILEV